MKFRTKLMVWITILLSAAFGLGGSLLIAISFNVALGSEKDSALSSYQMVLNTLSLVNEMNEELNYDDIASILKQLEEGESSGCAGMRLWNDNGTIYADSDTNQAADTLNSDSGPGMEDLRGEFGEGECALKLISTGNKHYLQISGGFYASFNGDDETIYLDGLYDVSSAYTARDSQITAYYRVFAGVIILGGATAWLTANLLTRPLRRLSQASKEIASGNLSSRVNIKTDDEIGMLAQDFNMMADRLEENITELRAAMKRQEEFMGSFAHELKTPMTSIIGYADLMRSQSLSEEDSIEAANYIFSEGKRLESLSFKLLDLIVLKKRDFSLVMSSPSSVIHSIVRLMKPALAKSNIVLQCRCERGACMMEPDLVKSLIINVVDNARKAMDKGGNIYIISHMTEDGCEISVTDNGRGMPEEAISRITEAFYRVDKSRSRAQGGVGLGLALCNEIAQLHNGSLEFKSIQGKGTVVTVYLRGGREL